MTSPIIYLILRVCGASNNMLLGTLMSPWLSGQCYGRVFVTQTCTASGASTHSACTFCKRPVLAVPVAASFVSRWPVCSKHNA